MQRKRPPFIVDGMRDAVVSCAGNEATKHETLSLEPNTNTCSAGDDVSNEVTGAMNGMIRAYLNGKARVQQLVSHGTKSQTMTEYALILAAVAIAAYVTYQIMGQGISTMVSGITSELSGA
jgi:Flp pilus assembly pilin Flp